MHIIQVVRNYLGLSQKELAQRAGVAQPDLCEMETKEPYGRIDKYKRLSEYLGIPIHALVTNDCTLIPLSFFDLHPPRSYTKNRVRKQAGAWQRWRGYGTGIRKAAIGIHQPESISFGASFLQASLSARL